MAVKKQNKRKRVNPNGVNTILRYPDKANWDRFVEVIESYGDKENGVKPPSINAILTVLINSFLRSEGKYVDPAP